MRYDQKGTVKLTAGVCQMLTGTVTPRYETCRISHEPQRAHMVGLRRHAHSCAQFTHTQRHEHSCARIHSHTEAPLSSLCARQLENGCFSQKAESSETSLKRRGWSGFLKPTEKSCTERHHSISDKIGLDLRSRYP